ncbi:MAG: ATP-binding protein [Synechocystis sp.]|jgi:anti-sigma regulatory factor (Ser/Thr protein kinase)
MEKLIVPGLLDSLSQIAAYVMGAANQCGLDKKSTYKLRLAVDEIATNIILHGYQEAGRSGDIAVEADISDAKLVIVIEDTGEPYDPTEHHLPSESDLATTLDEREAGGLGIYLVLEGVDEFKYQHDGDHNRNIFTMYTHS